MMSDDPLMVGDCGDVVAADPYAEITDLVIALAMSYVVADIADDCWSWGTAHRAKALQRSHTPPNR